MAIFASLFAAILPMITFMLIIWWFDKYDREPLTFVFTHFLWGSFGAALLGLGGTVILSWLTGTAGADSHTSSFIRTSLLAPLSEEFAKGSFLLYTINSKKFDGITDGLVYGGAIGLGFGMTENFVYFLAYGDSLSVWVQLVLIRSLFSALMHCISTATFGAFLAMAKFSSSRKMIVFPILGFIIASVIHSMWNLLVSFENTFLYGLVFMIVLIYFFFYVFRMAQRDEKRIIEEELSEGSDSDLIPHSHIIIISSNLRFRSGWIDEGIRKIYTRNAIQLAFRKNQLKKVSESQQSYYAAEVEKIRESIKTLLSIN